MQPAQNGNDTQLHAALLKTVQIPPSVTREGIVNEFSLPAARTSYLPPFGTRARDVVLRETYRMDEMVLIRGAISGIAKTVAGLPWQITRAEDEDENPLYQNTARQRGWFLRQSKGVEYHQEVLRQANFGGGWGELITQVVADFLRYDCGAFIEVIGAGDPFTPLQGMVAGVAHLDPLRCYPTGDPLYPAVYYDRWGGLHVLHHTRVIRLVDMIDGDDYRPGYGDSALARAISVAIRQMWTTRYINARVDDQPPPGLTVIAGITKNEWTAQQELYRQSQMTDAKPTYGQRQFYHTPDPSILPKIESYDFQSAPEKFDFRTYTDLDVDYLALALGVDRQELMQLSGGGALGSEGQSVILAQKSRGKTLGYLLAQLERKFNDLLPVEYTFEFKYRDPQESIEDANKAQVWADVAVTAGNILTPQQSITLLSNQVEAIKDAIDTAPRVNDIDVQPQAPVIQAPNIAEDNTAGITGESIQPRLNIDVEDEIKQKAYPVTESGFVQDVRDLLLSAIQPDNPILDRRGFGITMRSLLKRYGLQAYKDGLANGGVYVDTLDPEDNAKYLNTFAAQSAFISGLADAVYVQKSITPANAAARAQMWGKSLQEFLDAGTFSAASNAMFEWVLGVAEHCRTCLRLNGQVHRYKSWHSKGLMPRSSKLECRGYNCKCTLVQTNKKAQGRF